MEKGASQVYICMCDMKFAQLISCIWVSVLDVLDVPAESSKNCRSIHVRKIQCHKFYNI